MRGVFVTGTDTDAGKTHVALALLHALRAQGLRAVGFKPVAAGAAYVDGALRNADALALQAASDPCPTYAQVNPYCFAPAIAPHIAAVDVGVEIAFSELLAAAHRLAARSDFLVVEGAGGWRVPLGPYHDVAGLSGALGLPVLLVVGLRLGCLNHALLSAESIRASGQTLIGWIGTQPAPGMDRLDDNLATLRERLGVPCLGILRHQPQPDPRIAAAGLDLAPLLTV